MIVIRIMVLLLGAGIARLGYAIEASADGSVEMLKALNQMALADLLAAATAREWTAPAIPSRWYLDHVCPTDQKGAVEAARGVGSALLKEIDAAVPLVRTEQGDVLLARARMLVDFAYWVGATEGYENQMLAGRARDVAVVGLARLVAEINYPLSGVATELKRCHAPFDAPSVRASILNQESGAKLMPIDASLTQDRLAQIWQERVAAADVALKLSPTGEVAAGEAEGQRQEVLRRLQSDFQRKGVAVNPQDPHNAFFADDYRQCLHPATVRNCWDVKWHKRLVMRWWTRNLDDTEALVRFREAIGRFPDQPAVRRLESRSPIEEAFLWAWLEKKGASGGNEWAAAARIYDAVRSNTLRDVDSQEVAEVEEWARREQELQVPTAGYMHRTPVSERSSHPATIVPAAEMTPSMGPQG